MINEFTIENIGIGLCELKFKHIDTQCWFVITSGPIICNVGIVFCPLLYKKLAKTMRGRTISIPFLNSGDHSRIRNLAESIDREFIRQGRDLAFDYSIIVKGNRSRLILPCQTWLKESGYSDDIYSTIIASIKKCMNS